MAYTIFYLLLCIGASFIAGHIFRIYLKMGPILLGGICGFFIGALLINMIENIVFSWNHTEDLFGYNGSIIFLVIMTLIGTILAYKYTLLIMRVTQALISAYVFMRGLTFWYGGYPTEITIVKSSLNSEPLDLTN